MRYSTRAAAEVVGLSETTVRGCAHAGFLSPSQRGRGTCLQFSFRDLLVLRAVKTLIEAGVPVRRIRRQLKALRQTLPTNVALSQVSIRADGGQLVVCASDRCWQAGTGQVVFDFRAEPTGAVEPLRAPPEQPQQPQSSGMSSDEWFERAVELEEFDPRAAMEAYRQALHMRPDCTETLINLGRLRAEGGDFGGAADCFNEALRIDPGDATAMYNLGVVAQDEAHTEQAIDLYQRALVIDPGLAEAHYNLATLFDRQGDGQTAIRHINAYRKLTKGHSR